jgi:hypothetical protein
VSWLERARSFVQQATCDLPDSAPLAERRSRLREVGHRFHGNTFWGRRQYGRACREYLALHGGKEGSKLIRANDVARLRTAEAKGDIHFPFREAQR